MIRLKSLLKEQVMLTAEQEAWLDWCTGREKEDGTVGTFKFGDRPTFIGARTWNADNRGYVTVKGDFYCGDQNLTDFKGVKFATVTNEFNCSRNNLTSLDGAPQTVGESFLCVNNNLTNLVGAPQKVGGSFYCQSNELTSLKGAPREVGGTFNCGKTSLTSLEGSPQKVGGDFYCHLNSLTTLKGAPRNIDGDFYYPSNLGTPEEIKQKLDSQNSKVSGEIITVDAAGTVRRF